jgi:hypothetical protein
MLAGIGVVDIAHSSGLAAASTEDGQRDTEFSLTNELIFRPSPVSPVPEQARLPVWIH